jgi:pimeloyl-ACP methyl ester carboxylesterase
MSKPERLSYTESGRGLPVVLLHGFPLNAAIWHKQQLDLGDRFRVITPDLRGHGRSPVPKDGYEMESMAGDILAMLDSMRIQQAMILGHSMGGYVTLAAWRLAPERFAALGLIASHAAADTPAGKEGRRKLAEKVAAEGSQPVADAMLPKLFGKDSTPPEIVVEQVRQMIMNSPRAGLIGAINGMANRADSTDLLKGMKIPMLIVAGADDQIIPRDKVEAIAKAVKGSKLTIIEKAGHMPMLEQPDATTAAIREFLNTVK